MDNKDINGYPSSWQRQPKRLTPFAWLLPLVGLLFLPVRHLSEMKLKNNHKSNQEGSAVRNTEQNTSRQTGNEATKSFTPGPATNLEISDLTAQELKPLHDYTQALDWVKKMTSNDLEDKHNFIQRIFPTSLSSQAVFGSPVLSTNVVKVLQQGKQSAIQPFRTQQLEALDIMASKHFGLQVSSGKISITNATLLHTKLAPGNHNNARISRMLRSLNEFGNIQEAKSLMALLEKEFSSDPTMRNSLDHWRLNYQKSLPT